MKKGKGPESAQPGIISRIYFKNFPALFFWYLELILRYRVSVAEMVTLLHIYYFYFIIIFKKKNKSMICRRKFLFLKHRYAILWRNIQTEQMKSG